MNAIEGVDLECVSVCVAFPVERRPTKQIRIFQKKYFQLQIFTLKPKIIINTEE